MARECEGVKHALSESDWGGIGPALDHFMKLWERQEVGGKSPEWAFGIDYFQGQWERGRLLVFYASNADDDVLSVHPVEQHGFYVYAHPPLYDKGKHPQLAKFMWFNLMRWACENGIEHVDLGGGSNGTWRDCAAAHLNGPFQYKWLYVPKDSKRHPDEEPPYVQMRCECGNKQLILGPEPCRDCGKTH